MCNILDNDPRVHYTGPWVVAAQLPSTHSTATEGSTVSLQFKGRFYQSSLRVLGADI